MNSMMYTQMAFRCSITSMNQL